MANPLAALARLYPDILNAMLDAGGVFVDLDPRHPGVAVPQRLAGGELLRLWLSRAAPVPIPDLRVTADAITATLSFDRSPFAVVVPWDAVKGLVSDTARVAVVLDPPPLGAAAAAPVRAAAPKPARTTTKKRPGHLRLVT